MIKITSGTFMFFIHIALIAIAIASIFIVPTIPIWAFWKLYHSTISPITVFVAGSSLHKS